MYRKSTRDISRREVCDADSSVQQVFGHMTHAGHLDTRVPVSILSPLSSLLQQQHGGHS